MHVKRLAVAAAALVAVGALAFVVRPLSIGARPTAAPPTAATSTEGPPPAARSSSALPATAPSTGAVLPAAAAVPRPDHIVLVVLENKKYSAINGTASAPYLNSLAGQGATFSHSYAITHPSQPNYIALLSGSTQGVTSDDCPQSFSGENLAHQLIAAGLSFKGYSVSMPSDGYTGCSSGSYARKHNSWVDFTNVPTASNVRFSTFPTDFTTLPAVSYVVPDLCDDMHDCSIATGDSWMRSNLDAYVRWARTHNSVLIVTFDEDSNTSVNQIFTVFVGQHVKTGTFAEPINHYSVLRTIEDAYGLAAIGGASRKAPITDIWQ